MLIVGKLWLLLGSVFRLAQGRKVKVLGVWVVLLGVCFVGGLMGAPCELWVSIRCLDTLFLHTVLRTLLSYITPQCNCVAPPFRFMICTILLIKQKQK